MATATANGLPSDMEHSAQQSSVAIALYILFNVIVSFIAVLMMRDDTGWDISQEYDRAA